VQLKQAVNLTAIGAAHGMRQACSWDCLRECSFSIPWQAWR
jgi:hypothetical protein